MGRAGMLKRNWALIALVYLVLAELLSWSPVPDLALCLIQPEHGEQAADNNEPKYCPAFHTGIVATLDTVDGFLERHDKSVVGGFTIVLAISTIGLWLATNKLWAAGERQFELLANTAVIQSREMRASIKAAEAANKVSEAALIATDRAWISIKAEIIDHLVFDKDAVRIGVGFDLTNVGKSPATHVEIWSELCTDVVEAAQRGRQAISSLGLGIGSFGAVLFPSETKISNFLGLQISAESFRLRVQEARKISDRTTFDDDWFDSPPAIMACATYRLGGSAKTRHTVLLYEIRSIESGWRGWDGSKRKVDLATLTLVQSLMSGQVT